MIILPVLFLNWERQATLYVTSSSCGHQYDYIRRWPRHWPFISRHRSTGIWGQLHPDSTYCFHRPLLTLRRLFCGPSAGGLKECDAYAVFTTCYFRNPNSRRKAICLAVDMRFHPHYLLFCVVARLETDNIRRVVHQPFACIPSAMCCVIYIVYSCRSRFLESKPEYSTL